MNTDTIKGNWKQLKGEVKKQWGKLTDDALTEINGSREKLIGQLQEKYGIQKEKAEKQVKEWESKSTH